MKYLSFLLICVISFTSCERQEVELDTVSRTIPEFKTVTSNTKMVRIPGGDYLPFYSTNNEPVSIKPFLMDEHPVTNADFLAFVKANPQWQRSEIKRLYADTNYLSQWVSDTLLPEGAQLQAPVTEVSWHAAKAYADAVGKRLPLLEEWEFVAMADEDVPNAREKKSYSDRIISLYLIKNRQYTPVKQSAPNYWGVYNLFDLVWEWTDDFNSVLVTGDSRAGEYSNNNLFCAGSATSATDLLNYAAFMRFSMRAGLKANYTVRNLGFRCAMDITPVENQAL